MTYEDKMKQLEEAERKMLEAFNKYATENKVNPDIKRKVIERLKNATKNKKAEYFIENKLSNISGSINKVLSSSLDSLIDTENSSKTITQKSLYKKNESRYIAYE